MLQAERMPDLVEVLRMGKNHRLKHRQLPLQVDENLTVSPARLDLSPPTATVAAARFVTGYPRFPCHMSRRPDDFCACLFGNSLTNSLVATRFRHRTMTIRTSVHYVYRQRFLIFFPSQTVFFQDTEYLLSSTALSLRFISYFYRTLYVCVTRITYYRCIYVFNNPLFSHAQLVMDLSSEDLVQEVKQMPPLKVQSFDCFLDKYHMLKKNELKEILKVTIKEILDIMSESIDCVGCRRR